MFPRGKHDDLVMSLAIGVWLYDTSNFHSKSSADLNKAMLSGFSTSNSQYLGSTGTSYDNAYLRRVLQSTGAVPYELMANRLSGSMDTEFKWLL